VMGAIYANTIFTNIHVKGAKEMGYVIITNKEADVKSVEGQVYVSIIRGEMYVKYVIFNHILRVL